MKPIKLYFKIKGDGISAVPKGTTEELIIFIYEGSAIYRFTRASTTKEFVKIESKKEKVEAKYIERKQCAIFFYPNKTKEEISDYIKAKVKEITKKGKP